MAFPTTRWTMIQQAVAEPSAEAHQALESLCETYADPVLAFVRQRVSAPEQAEDVAQQFFVKLIDGPLLQRADPSVGRFRSFILHALRDFLGDVHDFENAQKRGGDHKHVSVDGNAIEAAGDQTAERAFELRWVRTLLATALDDLRNEYSRTTKAALFNSLQDRIDAGAKANTQDVAAALNMSDAAVRVALHRMRKRLGELIRRRIAETVPTEADVDDELRNLRRTLELSR